MGFPFWEPRKKWKVPLELRSQMPSCAGRICSCFCCFRLQGAPIPARRSQRRSVTAGALGQIWAASLPWFLPGPSNFFVVLARHVKQETWFSGASDKKSVHALLYTAKLISGAGAASLWTPSPPCPPPPVPTLRGPSQPLLACDK